MYAGNYPDEGTFLIVKYFQVTDLGKSTTTFGKLVETIMRMYCSVRFLRMSVGPEDADRSLYKQRHRAPHQVFKFSRTLTYPRVNVIKRQHDGVRGKVNAQASIPAFATTVRLLCCPTFY